MIISTVKVIELQWYVFLDIPTPSLYLTGRRRNWTRSVSRPSCQIGFLGSDVDAPLCPTSRLDVTSLVVNCTIL